MKILDYGSSFIGSTGPDNAVRFWVESHTRIINEKNSQTEDYYQCGSCKSEHTFADKELFMENNHDFIPVFGPEWSVIFRHKAFNTEKYRSYFTEKKLWGKQIYHFKEAAEVTELESNASVRKAAHEGLPLIARTEIHNARRQLGAIMEYPVKTININDEMDVFQVDTGPVAFPDLNEERERLVDAICLAFIAFNKPSFADFIIEDLNNFIHDDREICSVYHYSRILSLPAKNSLFCIGSIEA